MENSDKTKPTEREEKLLEYIKFLIQLCSLNGLYIHGLGEWNTWLNKSFDEIKVRERQEEVLSYLETEFGIKYQELNTDKEQENSKKDYTK